MGKPLIALTMGDPAGIGPEIIIRALGRPSVLKVCRPLVFGDRQVLAAAAARLGKKFVWKTLSLDDPWERIRQGGLVEVSSLEGEKVIPGRPDPRWAEATLAYIRQAALACLKGRVAAMVTCPISKEQIRQVYPSFTGHTEYLARLAGVRVFGMMLAGERLKVSLVTIHLPLKAIFKHLSRRKILQTITLTDRTLTEGFGIPQPRIAVAGLNPHAGEGGAFGDEEETLITPAVRAAQRQGLAVSGPHPPDTLFYRAARGDYDAVVALYHDQGLIPLKLLHFDNAVNLTMGLPFIRTSVDHGTAFDIAGKNMARPESLMAALITAAAFARRKSPWL